jgi:hypothetical protein
MKFSFSIICIWLASVGLAGATNAPALLTFDDLSPGSDYSLIPNGYGGLQWNNFGVIAGGGQPLYSGYWNGMVTSPNVAFIPYGAPASITSTTPFDLTSAYLAAAWQNGMQLEVKGLVGDTVAYDNTYTLGISAPTFVQFNYLGVDRVDFLCVSAYTQQLVMDNLIVTVPEPSVFAFGIFGVMGALVLRRRTPR